MKERNKSTTFFPIEDIHKIRCINCEKTKYLSRSELIENTNKRAEAVIKRLADMHRTLKKILERLLLLAFRTFSIIRIESELCRVSV